MRAKSPLQSALLNAAFAFIAAVLFLTVSLPHGWNGWYRLSQSGVRTQATVVSCRQDGKHQKMTYEYSVNSRHFTGAGMGCEGETGSSVAIVYLPSSPSVSASAFDQDKMKWAPLFVLGFPVLMGACGYWLAARRMRKNNEKGTDVIN
ncbi:MAG: DUF3592 domain-containing protein [Proteobacteria bacterium]|nr:DUF3592 domain-containing protein [Pseudomonadota bacterium]